MDVKYTMKPRTTMKTVMGVEGIFLTALFPCLVQATDEVQTNFHDNSSHNSSVDSAVHERFHVVVVDFHNVSVPFIISMCVVLASGAKIGFHRNNKLSSILPESCLLILVGLLLALVFWALGLGVYTLTPHTFFLLLLPPIVLDAAYFMPNRAFFDNIGTILVYAVVGSLLNTLAMAVTLWGASWLLWGSEGALLLHCLVFGALIGAVDPVAVLSLFDEVHVNEILHVIVFGESLLNDGVTVVLYHMFDSYSAIGVDNIRTVDVAAGVASFVVVSLASTAIGIVYGLATALITRFTDHVRVLEPLLVILMGYLSYLTAEIFHLSGILSCTFCAISMKKYVEANISHKSHTTIKYLMKMLAGVCETILFILLGISTVNSSHNWDTGFVLIALTACLVFRTLGVLLLTGCVNRLRIIKLNYVDQFIMSYGALRGAMAFSLVILLNDSLYPQKRLFLTTTIVITFFTVFIQGSTIKPLVNIFRVKKAPHDKPSMNEQIHDRMLDHLMAGVEDVTGFFGHHDLRLKFEHINTKYLKPILVRQRSLRKRGLSIVNMYQKLAEKDARQMISNGSLSKLTTHHMSQSMADHIAYTQLQGSQSKLDRPLSGLPFYDRNSCTQLDLQALEATDTRKMRDDSKTHHIVVDAMFRPRLKFSRHGRHMLPESDVYDLPLFHHKARMHLRHVLNHHHHKSHHGNGHSNAHISENGKPRKNVSFGQVTEVCAIDMESDRRSDRADIETESSHSLPQSVESSSSTNSDSNGGITFTAAPQTEGDVSAEKVIPTAVEVTLPWKRNTGRGPLSSSFTHSYPDEQHPLIGEAPSWVNNNQYTTASQVVIPDSLSPDTDENANPDVFMDLSGLCQQENNTLLGNKANAGGGNEDQGLPLPWRCNNDGDVTVATDHLSEAIEPQTLAVAVDTSGDVLPPPWRTTGQSEASLDFNMVGDVIPPPWRSNGQSEVSLDTNNHRHSPTGDDIDCIPPPPWRQTSENNPIRSPSVAHDLESYSMRPQPSCQSFRISEAESRHSEPHPVHHMIDKPHRVYDDHEVELDLPDTEPDQADTNDRIFNWLMSCEPDVFPMDDIDFGCEMVVENMGENNGNAINIGENNGLEKLPLDDVVDCNEPKTSTSFPWQEDNAVIDPKTSTSFPWQEDNAVIEPKTSTSFPWQEDNAVIEPKTSTSFPWQEDNNVTTSSFPWQDHIQVQISHRPLRMQDDDALSDENPRTAFLGAVLPSSACPSGDSGL